MSTPPTALPKIVAESAQFCNRNKSKYCLSEHRVHRQVMAAKSKILVSLILKTQQKINLAIAFEKHYQRE